MLKKYIQPQTDTVKVQAQAILAGSERFYIKPSDEATITPGEMESKSNNHYDVWED